MDKQAKTNPPESAPKTKPIKKEVFDEERRAYDNQALSRDEAKVYA